MDSILKIKELVRWHEWYDSKLPFLFIALSYILIAHRSQRPSPLVAFRLLAFGCVYLAFGYALNDFSDREQDSAANKPNAMSELPPAKRLLFLAALFTASLLILPLQSTLELVVVITSYFFAIFYSLPPLRFKERGLWGLLVSAAAQRSLPVLLFFSAYTTPGWVVVALCILYLFIGLRWMFIHQIIDVENDLRTGVHTLATIKGTRWMRLLLAYLIFPCEVAFLLITIFLLAQALPWLIPLSLLYCLWLIVIVWRRSRTGLLLTLFSYQWAPLEDFYFIYLPLLLALHLATLDPLFFLLPILTIIWQQRYIRRELADFRRMFLMQLR